ncbi:double-strand break repair protein AddB [Thalassobaculum fulvum]|uniref:Double-strand break repair protein AddB n=1 Tax=Thalassobaculum fulvum TaxID=1633335 RepID=A0A918XN05_9PROT|nr:double-strand break repair protein AddB [Thalassobaculum fulvum]GHD40597.1 double-strand break repair protein AddB [Thalassobaculum fulvum]
MDGGRVYTIPVGVPFLDALAAGLWEAAGRDPLVLSRATVLLPTQRAARSAAEAFLRLGDGRPMLLPTLQALADVDDQELDLAHGDDAGIAAALDLPPAIPALRRQLLLARLVLAYADRLEADGVAAPRSPEQAARLAAALARLIDQVQAEGLDFGRLADIVPADYAEHWGLTLRFLEIVTETWPQWLAEQDAVDPVTRRDALMRARAAAWDANPPADPVVIAGSTGSVPATAGLMRAVLGLPRGALVLPGLDLAADDDAWAAIGADPAHPQHGMHRLLGGLGIGRAEVADWPGAGGFAPASAGRAAMVREAMRPAATTEAWRTLATDPAQLDAGCFDGIRRIDAPGPREEAGAIAVLMREVLETPGRTAALVTPDRDLARRVASELERWDVPVNDSAGRPLAESVPAAFLRLVADLAAEQAAPVPLLAALKHPLAAGGQGPDTFRRLVRRLERRVLRGPRPGPGIDGLRAAVAGLDDKLAEERAGLLAWLDDLAARLGDLPALMAAAEVPAVEIAAAHARAAEALAATADESGADRLWRGDSGEALARLFDEMRDALAVLGGIPGRTWPGLFEALLEGRAVRPRWGAHPRLHILGALEARLQRFDRVILGGLNEGSWPADPPPDPWMSRPMRRDFGLPAPERRIGLAAHDVTMALGAPEAVLTRSIRVEGTPTVPSRWLLRLDTVARALGAADRFAADPVPAAWHAELDRPDAVVPGAPPLPRPPVAVRPRRLSVTRIETWLRDPYSIYASQILKLRALDDLDTDPSAAERGDTIHRALDIFVREHPRDLPPDPLQRLLEIGRQTFAGHMDRPGVRAFWWPRFERVAAWFVEVERDRRRSLSATATEQRGELTVDGPAGPFTVTGIADRIDRLADGSYAIVDYKTGGRPTRTELKNGAAPQLPLEALMLAHGGFPGLPAGETSSLAYWRVGGGDPPGTIDEVADGIAELVAEAEAGLRDLIATFDDPATPYHSVPDAARKPRFNDYEHLARIGEWAAGEEE